MGSSGNGVRAPASTCGKRGTFAQLACTLQCNGAGGATVYELVKEKLRPLIGGATLGRSRRHDVDRF